MLNCDYCGTKLERKPYRTSFHNAILDFCPNCGAVHSSTDDAIKLGPMDVREKRKRNIDILIQRNSGKTLAEIGSQYDISRQRVHQIIKKLNNPGIAW